MQPEIDTATGDYTGDRISGLANAVFLRLMTPRGSYWGIAEFGSRLHELAREKDVARVALLAEQYARDALQPLIDDGRAAAVDVAAARSGGRLTLHVVVRDAGGQALYDNSVQVI